MIPHQSRFREATATDLPAIVALLCDDVLGRSREGQDLSDYVSAFDAIQANPCHDLIVADIDGDIAGCYQLTIIHGLSLKASRRALIEGVRIARPRRGSGFGKHLMANAERRTTRHCGRRQSDRVDHAS